MANPNWTLRRSAGWSLFALLVASCAYPEYGDGLGDRGAGGADSSSGGADTGPGGTTGSGGELGIGGDLGSAVKGFRSAIKDSENESIGDDTQESNRVIEGEVESKTDASGKT